MPSTNSRSCCPFSKRDNRTFNTKKGHIIVTRQTQLSTKFTREQAKRFAVHIGETKMTVTLQLHELQHWVKSKWNLMLVLSLRKLCRPAGLSHSSERSFRIRSISQIGALICVNNSEGVVSSVNLRAVFSWVSKVIGQLLWFWFYYGLRLAE